MFKDILKKSSTPCALIMLCSLFIASSIKSMVHLPKSHPLMYSSNKPFLVKGKTSDESLVWLDLIAHAPQNTKEALYQRNNAPLHLYLNQEYSKLLQGQKNGRYYLSNGKVLPTEKTKADLKDKLIKIDDKLGQLIEKYYPNNKDLEYTWNAFPFDSWSVKHPSIPGRKFVLNLPITFTTPILDGKEPLDTAGLFHELGHVKHRQESPHLRYENLPQWKKFLYWILGQETAMKNKYKKAEEQFADEQVPNDPKLLFQMKEHFKHVGKEHQKYKEAQRKLKEADAVETPLLKSPHLPHDEREERFAQRWHKLHMYKNLAPIAKRKKLENFFGEKLPPYIESDYPQGIAQKEGLDTDYYPAQRTFLLPSEKPKLKELEKEEEK